MSDSQTLYVRTLGTVAELDAWKGPRPNRVGQPANRADLPKDDLQSHWREDHHIGRNAIVPMGSLPDAQFLPAVDSVATAGVSKSVKLIDTEIPVTSLVPPSKMTGGWFREDPW